MPRSISADVMNGRTTAARQTASQTAAGRRSLLQSMAALSAIAECTIQVSKSSGIAVPFIEHRLDSLERPWRHVALGHQVRDQGLWAASE